MEGHRTATRRGDAPLCVALDKMFAPILAAMGHSEYAAAIVEEAKNRSAHTCGLCGGLEHASAVLIVRSLVQNLRSARAS